MQKNSLLQNAETVIRILDIKENKALIIDCVRLTVPKWLEISALSDYTVCTEAELSVKTNIAPLPIDDLDADSRRYAYEHYTIIAGVLPYVADEKERCYAIAKIAEQRKISKQTVKNNLCLFLAYQNISALAPKKQRYDRPLTQDEKNMRWALNKYFYTCRKNSLQTAYTLMLKEKYCDMGGKLLSEYPSIHQFRYFYRKHKSLQTFYISRNGLKNYQRNNRPLTGDGIQEFAPAVGVGMLDATICDIYLVNDGGGLVGRPILTACIDAFSGLCCGYSLSWEGGVYSLRNLMLNVIADKVKWCKRYGIDIKPLDWDCSGIIPGVLVTDMGSEYKSENFEQVAELGVTVMNLPPYRPELKGAVEKFFDVIQGLFKPYLKGKGVIEPDFQERGAHDYRKDACLTMANFEKLILTCIVHYNSGRIIDGFPYTDAMIADNVKPYANTIWNWSRKQTGANLIPVGEKQLVLTLLPRTKGTFSRYGLRVNKLRYHSDGFTERYLKGGNVTVAYNPDDVSGVWLFENGNYTEFSLIESRFAGKSLDGVQATKQAQSDIIKAAQKYGIQAKITLAERIQTIADNSTSVGFVDVKAVRTTRQKEREKQHIDIMEAQGK